MTHLTPILSLIPDAPANLEPQILKWLNSNYRQFKDTKYSVTVQLPNSKQLLIDVAESGGQRNCLLNVMVQHLSDEQWNRNGANFPQSEGNNFIGAKLTLKSLRGLNAKYLSAAFNMQNPNSQGRWRKYPEILLQRLQDEYKMVHKNLVSFHVDNMVDKKAEFLSKITSTLYYAGMESVQAMADLFLINILVIQNGKNPQLIQPKKYFANLPEIAITVCLFHQSIKQGNDILHYYYIVIDMKLKPQSKL